MIRRRAFVAVGVVGLLLAGAALAFAETDCSDGLGNASEAAANNIATGLLPGGLGTHADTVADSAGVGPQSFSTTFNDCSDPLNDALGGDSGDPHLLSLDGLRYDFHGRGDYVLLGSADPDVEIQVRHVEALRIGSSLRGVAIEAAGTVVTVEELGLDLTPIIAINGTIVDLGQLGWFDVPSGVIVRVGDVVTVRLDDGAIFEMGPTGMSVSIPPSWTGPIAGLLGNRNGDPGDDVATAAGVLVDPGDFDGFYGPFLESWLVGPADSLFTTPFDEDADGPVRPGELVTLADLDPAAVESAEEVCGEAGFEPGSGLEECMFDVALTGDERWADDVPTAAKQLGVSVAEIGPVSERASQVVAADLGEDPTSSIGVGPDGTVHIVFHDDTGNLLMYSVRVPGSAEWQTEIVDGDGFRSDNTNVGDPNALVVGDGVVILSYYEAIPNDLNLAVGNLGDWALSAVDDSGDGSGTHHDLAIDDAGGLHIAYFDQSDGDLRYGYRPAGGEWTLSPVDVVGDVGRFASIAVGVGPGPVVHIAYQDSTSETLRHAVGSAAGFTTETVDSATGTGEHTDVAIGNDGRVHISYLDEETVKHAWNDGGPWQMGTAALDLNPSAAGRTSISVTDDGRVHVAYRAGEPEGLALASGTAGGSGYTWDVRTVHAGDDIGGFASMTLGPAGRLHFAYQDRAAEAVLYTTVSP
jgi:hypothetical protein